MATALTTKSVESARPGSARREIPDGRLVGLYLVVQPSGAKSWAVRYRFAGKPRKLAIGPLAPALPGDEPEAQLGGPLTLAGARRIGRDQLLKIAAGHDPAAERQAAKAAAKNPPDVDRDLFRAVADQFLERYLMARAKPGYYKSVSYILEKDVVSRWGALRIQAIGRREVLELLDSVVERGAAVQANRVLAAVRKLFNWAVSRDIIAVSPVAGVKTPSPEVARDRVLTDDELRLFWRASGEVAYPFGSFAKLLLLTGTRRDEAAGLRRSELSVDAALWTLPAARTKNSRAHTLPLSAQAQSAVAEAPVVAMSKEDAKAGVPRHGKHRDIVFTTTGLSPVSGFAKGKTRIDAAMLKIAREDAKNAGADEDEIKAVKLEPWTFHDLRRTVATGMARLGVELPVIERCLNHVSGSFGGVVGIYQRHTFADEMRTAFASWGAHVDGLIAERSAASVTPIRGRRRHQK